MSQLFASGGQRTGGDLCRIQTLLGVSWMVMIRVSGTSHQRCSRHHPDLHADDRRWEKLLLIFPESKCGVECWALYKLSVIRTRGRSCCCEQLSRAGGHPGKSPEEATDPHPSPHPNSPPARLQAGGCRAARRVRSGRWVPALCWHSPPSGILRGAQQT